MTPLLALIACSLPEPTYVVAPESGALRLSAPSLRSADLSSGGAVLEGSRVCMTHRSSPDCWSLEADVAVFEPPDSQQRCALFLESGAAQLDFQGAACVDEAGQPVPDFGSDRLQTQVLPVDDVELHIRSREQQGVATTVALLESYAADYPGLRVEKHGPRLRNPLDGSGSDDLRVWRGTDRLEAEVRAFDASGAPVSFDQPWRMEVESARSRGGQGWDLDGNAAGGVIELVGLSERLEAGTWSHQEDNSGLRTRLHVWVTQVDQVDPALIDTGPVLLAWYEVTDADGAPVDGAPVQYDVLGARAEPVLEPSIFDLSCEIGPEPRWERLTVTATLGWRRDTEAVWVYLPGSETSPELELCEGQDEQAGGCSTSPAHPSGLGALLLLIGAFIRRRGEGGREQRAASTTLP